MTIDFIMRAYLLRCAGVLLLVFLLSGDYGPYAEVLHEIHIPHGSTCLQYPTRTGLQPLRRFKSDARSAKCPQFVPWLDRKR